MRIGMLTQWFDPEPGPARLPGALARSLNRRGHEVQVVTGFPNYPDGKVHPGFSQGWTHDEVWHDVSVRRVPLVPSHSSSMLGRLANYVSFGLTAATKGVSAFQDVDALWVSNSPITVALPMWRTLRRYRVPSLLHVLDLWPDNVTSSDLLASRCALRGIANVIHRWNGHMYGSADHIAGISPGIVETIASRGVPRRKLSYIPMWANEAEFRPIDGTAIRQEFGVPPETVVVLYAGTLGRTQAIDALLEGAQKYSTSAPPIEVWIAGSGVEEESLRRRAVALDHPRVTVRMLGRVISQKMATVMGAADVHYVGLRDDPNSRITMPSKIQATMACGKPMILAVAGDAEAVVTDAEAGFMANPGDPTTIATALGRAANLGRGGLASSGVKARAYYTRSFSLASATDRIESVLESLVRARRNG